MTEPEIPLDLESLERAGYTASEGWGYVRIPDPDINPYRDEFDQINPLFDSDDPWDRVEWFWGMLRLWECVRNDNGYNREADRIDMAKSCLLFRMMLERKPPMATPPPTAAAMPQYKWAEELEAKGWRYLRVE